MNDATELLAYELRRRRTTPSDDRDARNRSVVVTARRVARRHRLAQRVRSVADRLEA